MVMDTTTNGMTIMVMDTTMNGATIMTMSTITMNKSLVTGLIVGVAVAAGAGAVASFKMRSNEPDYAKVIEVTPLTKAIKTARQSCHDETVTHQVKPRDSNQVIGTVAGAVLGGVIGHQIGGGSGRDIATVAGAAAGGYGGNRIEKHMQDKNTYTTTEPRCETVYDKSEKQVGYSVRYRLGNQERTIKMNHDPGDRIPVHDGQLVLDDSPGTQDKKS